MNYFKLPITSDNSFARYTVQLSGVSYTLHLRWNERAGRWFMDIASALNEPIVSSVPMLIMRNLVSRFAFAALPPGTLFILDDTWQNTEPGRYAWGTTHSLYYGTP